MVALCVAFVPYFSRKNSFPHSRALALGIPVPLSLCLGRCDSFFFLFLFYSGCIVSPGFVPAGRLCDFKSPNSEPISWKTIPQEKGKQPNRNHYWHQQKNPKISQNKSPTSFLDQFSKAKKRGEKFPFSTARRRLTPFSSVACCVGGKPGTTWGGLVGRCCAF